MSVMDELQRRVDHWFAMTGVEEARADRAEAEVRRLRSALLEIAATGREGGPTSICPAIARKALEDKA